MPANPTGPPTPDREKERIKFEKWARVSPGNWNFAICGSPNAGDMAGEYLDAETYYAFEAWQAAIIARHAPGAEGWVSVKERMPEYGTVMLVHGFDKDSPTLGYTDIATYSYMHGWCVGHDCDNDTYTVTHWSALPAPPACASKLK